jgi:dCTP diphosphatase
MNSDADTTLADLRRWIREFTDARDWAQFHNPKDLGVALAIEVGEVLEHFRFCDNDAIQRRLADPNNFREFAHELADCLWALVRLADITKVDLATALAEKLQLADQKYPVEKSRGLPHKYTAYQDKSPPQT